MWFWHCAASCVGVRRLALRGWGVGRPRACVHACMQGVSGTRHVGLWLRCVFPARNDRLRGASSPHLPPTSGQALCSTAAGVCKFIMRQESETESESADFFTNPSETVRLPDFENRNNTTENVTRLNQNDVSGPVPLPGPPVTLICLSLSSPTSYQIW